MIKVYHGYENDRKLLGEFESLADANKCMNDYLKEIKTSVLNDVIREAVLLNQPPSYKGKILKIPKKEGLKIPHMGWNSLKVKESAKLFKGITENPYVYFVHSYYLEAKNEEDVAATTDYSTLIHASVEKDNIFACQFHPEKSGEVGLKILENFANL